VALQRWHIAVVCSSAAYNGLVLRCAKKEIHNTKHRGVPGSDVDIYAFSSRWCDQNTSMNKSTQRVFRLCATRNVRCTGWSECISKQ